MISTRITTVFILLFQAVTIKAQQIPKDKNWEGIMNLSTKGEQKIYAEFNFKANSGTLLMPDLIPVPLRLTDVQPKKEKIEFTIGFRSGPAKCIGYFKNDTISGTMHSDGIDESKFWLTYNSTDSSTFQKPSPNEAVQIDTYNGSNAELITKNKLKHLLKKYELEPYLYTKKIMVRDSTIPHSHPTLTLSTRDTTEELLLSTFLHEQMHWYSIFIEDQSNNAISKLKKMYKKVPSKLPEGGGSEFSTYLHLLVNYLEFYCLTKVIGREKAQEVMNHWAKHHYTWIYETVLTDEEKIRKVLDKYGVLDNLST